MSRPIIQNILSKPFFHKLLAIYLLLLSGTALGQTEIDSLNHFNLVGPVKSVVVQSFRITGDSDTAEAYIPSGPHQLSFYKSGMLKEKVWFGYSGETIKRVSVEKNLPLKIGVVHYSNDLSESVSGWFSYEFNPSGQLIRTVESRGNGHFETTEFVYVDSQLKERLVYEQKELLSHFKYDYKEGQKQWFVKSEFNNGGSLVDTKSQYFDSKNRLVRFLAVDAEEGPIEDKTIQYIGDSIEITTVKLNLGLDQGLVLVDSTIEKIQLGNRVLRLNYDDENRLVNQASWVYESGRLMLKKRQSAEGDTISLKLFEYPFERRVIEKTFGSNVQLQNHEEYDLNLAGNRVFFCSNNPPREKWFHYRYDTMGNLIETVSREINSEEQIDITVLEIRTIIYYED